MLIIDSTCTVGGKPATFHAAITGSFDSAYAMTVTAKGEGLPAGMLNMTLTASWLGARQPGQKSGDVVMLGGKKVDIPELQKRVPSPDLVPR
jgi:hypothetical protein